MRFTQLIETFVITNDAFEDYLNRSTEQLKSELDMGKNLRDAIHDLARAFADQHNKSYEAYERMSDSLLARSHILELGNDSATIDQEPTDIEPEMDMGEPAMDMPEPEMEESVEDIDEGPCDIAKPEEIEKMTGTEYDKYAKWKQDCEADERTTPLSTKRLESYSDDYDMDGTWEDDYEGDLDKEEHDKTVKNSEMEYTVWVGGTEVNDHWLSKEEAVALYNTYKNDGHDDIQMDVRIKEGHVSEETTEEGNEFSGELAKAKIDGKKEFKVGGKKYKVEEDESEERPYIVVHAKKGKHETHATSSYDAAKNAAEHWGLKSTAGVSAHLADVEHVADSVDFEEDVLTAPKKDDEAVAARDDFVNMMSSKPKSSNKAIDTIKKIVADKQNMQVKFDDGKMKVDLFTANAVSQVYDAVKPETREKIDNMLRSKEGMLKMANFAFKSIKEGFAPGQNPNSVATRIKPGWNKTAPAPASTPKTPGVGSGQGAGSKATQIKPGWNKTAPASKKPGLGKLATGVAIGKAVAGTVGKAAKGLGKMVGGAATRSGFGNPLSASKYSESKAVDIMAEAAEAIAKEDSKKI
jgi:hypothetical protein|tara:strand:- start:5315 stop:7054 length:1740 start_codon:yes stop_codon:yes gene_type:complete